MANERLAAHHHARLSQGHGVGAVGAPVRVLALGVGAGAEIVGGLVGLGLVVALYPDAARTADDVVVPHNPHQVTASDHEGAV